MATGRRSKLKDKQEKFVHEYRKDRNATQAAIRSGYSKKNADVVGPRLLGNVGITERIRDLDSAFWRREQMTGDEALGRMARIARADPAQCFDSAGRLLPPEQWPKEIRDAVTSFKVVEAGTRSVVEPLLDDDGSEIEGAHPESRIEPLFAKEVRFADRLKALELIAKQQKVFGDPADQMNAFGKTVAEIILAAQGKSTLEGALGD